MRRFIAILFLLTLFAGCAVSTQITTTPRSSIEERLLITSFERALATLDTRAFKGKTVIVDFFGLTGDSEENGCGWELLPRVRPWLISPAWLYALIGNVRWSDR